MGNVSYLKNAVWDEAREVRGKDPNRYRQDPYGNEMFKASYGWDTPMGWVIDHIEPVSLGGSDEISNLQAMNTDGNRELGNSTDKKDRHSQQIWNLAAMLGWTVVTALVKTVVDQLVVLMKMWIE